MRAVLSTRAQIVKGSEEAIRYISVSGEMRNLDSAAVSAGGRCKPVEDGPLVWKRDFLACHRLRDG
jgi:hypothetical protein